MNLDFLHVGRARMWGSIALVLTLILLVTLGVRAWHLNSVAESVEELQARDVERAAAHVERDLERRITDLMRTAQTHARSEGLLRGLRSIHRGDDLQGYDQVTREVATWQTQDRRSVEVYNVLISPIAWNGFSMPVDMGPQSPPFQEQSGVAVSSDESYRDALEVWWPVHEGRSTLGHIRVMEQLQYRTPVQNQYLRDYHIADAWTQETRLQIDVDFGVADTSGFVFRSDAGEALATIYIQPPSAERLLQHTAHFYDGFAALLVAILMILLLAAAWEWYREARDSADGLSVHRYLWSASLRFVAAGIVLWTVRYLFLAIDIPERWAPTAGALAPLFDPSHLASTLGGGLFRSTGDLFITGIFAFIFAVGFLDLATRFRNKGLNLMQMRERLFERRAVKPSSLRLLLVVVITTLFSITLVTITAVVARRAVLDSTLDYLTRTGLLPDLLTLVVYCGLLLIVMSVLLIIACISWMAIWFMFRYWPKERPLAVVLAGIALAIAGTFAIWFGFFEGMGALTWSLGVTFFLVGISIAVFGFMEPGAGLELLALRRLLPAMLLITVLLYPLLYTGMDTQRRERMVDAVESFSDGQDPRVLFSMEQVLQEIRTDRAVPNLIHSAGLETNLDSLTEGILRGSLLISLGTYEVTLGLYDADGQPLGHHTALGPATSRRAEDETTSIEFDVLRQMYREMGAVGTMVEQMTAPRARHRFQYAGLVPIFDPGDEPTLPAPGMGDDEEPIGWAVLWAEPQSLIPEGGTPFPRVLLPAGYYGDLYTNFSLAEFRQGALVRSLGRDFGRYRLDEEIQEILRTQNSYWRGEEVKGRSHLTYYQRQPGADDTYQMAQTLGTSVTAARAPAIITFDHLYYILRLFIASLLIGAVLYFLGLYTRWQRGQLPAEQVRFRDKMQNSFLIVGVLSVIVVGWIGMEVLTDENRRSTQNWLRQRLEQVEETLLMESRQNEPPHQTIERIGIDELAIRVGLDLNLYEDGRLVETSRPRLVRERLMDARMPVEAYQALHFDGYRFTTTDQYIGDFDYTAGYRALADEEGQTRYVISVPTLPEQERMEEEQARTIAYLFGALLLLVVIIMLTASLLAGALARPIARLREGLEAIGKGEFAQALPVDTRDEIGELVETFNEMREQLAESRRKLAHQERELAWREMARQVAHEIKNPLTPMKLSVQHLRRAFKGKEVPAGEQDGSPRGDFSQLFDRITATLIEQIDALARIADEFSSFSRLPTRVPELLDLNEVIAGAVSLMREEVGVDIETSLHEEPLVVEADQEELRRAYINLLKNAVQAIPDDQQGEVQVKTAFEPDSESKHGWAFSTVSDNGMGIPRELRDKIFQPNFSTKNSGTGLGLAIVKKSVEDMHGEIGFETVTGEGTTFWIKLPLTKKK